MKTFRVTSWNTYKIDDTGHEVTTGLFRAETLAEAMDMATRGARAWNRNLDDGCPEINFVSCGPMVRAIG